MVGELDVVKIDGQGQTATSGKPGTGLQGDLLDRGNRHRKRCVLGQGGCLSAAEPPSPPPQLEERMHPCARSSKGMQGGVEGPNRLTHLAWEVNWGLRRHGPASSGKADEEGDGGMRGG